ncbi:MAG: AAA family ATPase [Candidatus Nanohaloarchaea archaeon]|nr:AAA family ATPase [Candidatus Nanohaloarchaea archaeon]
MYGITGMPLAGKTLVANIMKEKGYRILDMGDVVRKEMEKRNISMERTGEFVNSQREERGMDAIAQLSIPYLRKRLEETDKIVITGMRGWSEKKKFEEEVENDLEMVAIWASRETRRERRNRRQREEDVRGQSFQERDMREIDNGIAKLMALSDRIIINDGISIDRLRVKVFDLLEGDKPGL